MEQTFLFDLLHAGGDDLLDMPLELRAEVRRYRLEKSAEEAGTIDDLRALLAARR